jgi:hypothetical protein
MQPLTTSGSIDGVGWGFQPFKINDLELVAQIFTGSNPLMSWLQNRRFKGGQLTINDHVFLTLRNRQVWQSSMLLAEGLPALRHPKVSPLPGHAPGMCGRLNPLSQIDL